MEWLNKAIAQQGEEITRREAVIASAPEIYEALWSAILKVTVDPVAKSMFAPRTNGTPEHRKVIVEGGRTLQIDLSASRAAIIAAATGLVVQFDLISDKNEVVGLYYNGKSVNYDQAAEIIMKPFLLH